MHEPEQPTVTPRASLLAWWRAGTPSVFFGRPRWPDAAATPGVAAALVLASTVLAVVLHRLYVDGPARFYWPALTTGWLPTAVLIWACWRLAPGPGTAPLPSERAASASALFALCAAQGLVLTIAINAIALGAARGGSWSGLGGSPVWAWLWWLVPLAWCAGAQALLLWRGGHGSARVRAACVALCASATAATWWGSPAQLWYPDETRSAQAADEPAFLLTPASLEAQGRSLARHLESLAPERQGTIDVYALTFAPYADEDVFLRESEMVASVMAERFGAEGRTLQLVNHRRTVAEHPWATPENLERALQQMAARMNRDEDVLFIHLTSHGARSGQLTARFWPLGLEALTPQRLKAAMDAAGVRHRIVSISACYSGSWIAPLADEHTMVMSASDAERTSYGCGRGSELTFFGRAMFDEALRATRSFEEAYTTARRVIEQREKDAGKADGYSNPQIHVGTALRERLSRLTQQLEAGAR
jgi:hypothetical protein